MGAVLQVGADMRDDEGFRKLRRLKVEDRLWGYGVDYESSDRGR